MKTTPSSSCAPTTRVCAPRRARCSPGPAEPRLECPLTAQDQLVHAQYDFIGKLIDSTAKSFSKDDVAKANGVR
jgi:hypothetical protein